MKRSRRIRFISLLSFFCAALFCASCHKETPTSPGESKPSIVFISPGEDAVILESATIEIQVTAQKPVTLVELTIDSSANNKRVFSAAPFRTAWQTDTLPEGSIHVLVAKAYFGDGSSIVSSPRHVTVYHFTPSNLSARMVSDTLISLRWKDNCAKETSFELEGSINGGPFAPLQQPATNDTTALVSGRYSVGDSLAFRIRAVRDSLNSSYSNVAHVSIVFPAPGNLVLLSLTDTDVQLSWQDNAGFGNAFVIEHGTNGIAFSTLGVVGRDTLSAAISDTFAIDSTHYFRVRARSTVNTSGTSNTVSSILRFNAPTGLSTTGVSKDTVILQWKNNSAFERGFAIERQVSGGAWTEIQRVGSNMFSWIDASIDTASSYTYRVRAFTTLNYSSYSQTFSIHFSFDNTAFLTIQPNNPGGYNNIWTFDFTSDGTSLICATGFQTNMYNLSTGALMRTFGRFRTAAPGLALSRDGSTVMAFGANDSTVTAWRVSDGSQIMSYKEDTWLLNSMDISADGSYFAIGGVNRVVRFRSTSTGALIREIPGATWSQCLLFNPAGDLLVSGTGQANAQIIRVSDGTILDTLSGFRDQVSSVSFNSAGTLLATGSHDYSVELWNLNGALISSYPGNTNYVTSVALNPDGNMIASGGYDPYVRIWNVADGTLMRTLPGYGAITTICRFSPNGKYFASGGYDSRIHIYKAYKEWLPN